MKAILVLYILFNFNFRKLSLKNRKWYYRCLLARNFFLQINLRMWSMFNPFGQARINVLWLYSLKFIYSEKATKFCEISTIDLSYVVPVKSTVEISQNFVVFSEYMNFKCLVINLHMIAVIHEPLYSQ